jgi:putative transcription factor
MCGYESRSLHDVIVEGSMLRVCDRCTTYGKLIQVTRPKASFFGTEDKQTLPSIGEIIVEDYGSRIRSGREQQKLTQEELATHIQEKISVIHRLEARQQLPTLSLARKLEKFLHIQLVEQYTSQEKKSGNINIHDHTLTIGDLIKIKGRM